MKTKQKWNIRSYTCVQFFVLNLFFVTKPMPKCTNHAILSNVKIYSEIASKIKINIGMLVFN